MWWFMGGSINGGTLKWMVDKGKPHLKWMITGGSPILGNPNMPSMMIYYLLAFQDLLWNKSWISVGSPLNFVTGPRNMYILGCSMLNLKGVNLVSSLMLCQIPELLLDCSKKLWDFPPHLAMEKHTMTSNGCDYLRHLDLDESEKKALVSGPKFVKVAKVQKCCDIAFGIQESNGRSMNKLPGWIITKVGKITPPPAIGDIISTRYFEGDVKPIPNSWDIYQHLRNMAQSLVRPDRSVASWTWKSHWSGAQRATMWRLKHCWERFTVCLPHFTTISTIHIVS